MFTTRHNIHIWKCCVLKTRKGWSLNYNDDGKACNTKSWNRKEKTLQQHHKLLNVSLLVCIHYIQYHIHFRVLWLLKFISFYNYRDFGFQMSIFSCVLPSFEKEVTEKIVFMRNLFSNLKFAWKPDNFRTGNASVFKRYRRRRIQTFPEVYLKVN